MNILQRQNSRARSVLANLAMAVGTLGLLVVPAMSASATEPTDVSEGGTCVPVTPENPLNSAGLGAYVDNNPSIYVGGDAKFLNHEGEGTVIVEGNATFKSVQIAGQYHLGANVSGGSGAWPEDGSLTLFVGKDLNVEGGRLFLGGVDHWGTYYVGGTQNGDVFSGEKGIGSLPNVPSQGYRERLETFDSVMAGVQSNGSVSASADGAGLDLVGDGTSSLQKFDIDYGTYGQILSGANVGTPSQVGLNFTDIPDGASIVLNVTGTGAEQLKVAGTVNFTVNGNEISAPKPPYTSWYQQDLGAWGNLTQRVLWRFPDASKVVIGEESDHQQFTGTIFASKPDANLDVYESTNGRIISFGDLTIEKGDPSEGQLTEFHSFPFLFDGLGCSHREPGSFVIHKELAGDAADQVPAGTTFLVEANWVDASGSHSEKLTLSADGTPVYHANDPDVTLPADTVVTFKELEAVYPDGQSLPYNVKLDSAVFSPASIVIGADDQALSQVTVTNTYSTVPSGTFTLQNQVVDQDGQVIADAQNLKFTVKANIHEQRSGQSIELTVPADGSVVRSPLLGEGTELTFEGTAAPTLEGYEFDHVEFSPEQVTIAADENIAVAMKNVYRKVELPLTPPPTTPNPGPGTTTPNPGPGTTTPDPGTDIELPLTKPAPVKPPVTKPAVTKPAESHLAKTGASGALMTVTGSLLLLGMGLALSRSARRQSDRRA